MNKSVLAILSHVVHGHVGNRAMLFPLQYCGWDVDTINTTDFSNHPGYGSFAGVTTDRKTIHDIMEGLDVLEVKYDMVITGYVSNVDILDMMYERLTQLPKATLWIVDPVMGDSGRLYVSQELVPIYQKILASGKVSLTTPNQFEFETLIHRKITNKDSLIAGIEAFQELYKVENLVISSILVDGQMVSVGVNSQQIFYIPISQVDCHFNGSGDLFTALLANKFTGTIGPETLSDCLVKIHSVLSHTYQKVQAHDASITNIKDLDIIGLRNCLLQDNTKDLLEEVVFLKSIGEE